MKLHYNPEEDILIIHLKESKISHSDDQKWPGVIVDQDEQNDIVRMEILSASRRVSDLGKVTLDFPVRPQMPLATA